MELFVGLKHLEPGSRTSGYGHCGDRHYIHAALPPGEVLFGKRWAHQRKLAVAEIDRVVSVDMHVPE